VELEGSSYGLIVNILSQHLPEGCLYTQPTVETSRASSF